MLFLISATTPIISWLVGRVAREGVLRVELQRKALLHTRHWIVASYLIAIFPALVVVPLGSIEVGAAAPEEGHPAQSDMHASQVLIVQLCVADCEA